MLFFFFFLSFVKFCCYNLLLGQFSKLCLGQFEIFSGWKISNFLWRIFFSGIKFKNYVPPPNKIINLSILWKNQKAVTFALHGLMKFMKSYARVTILQVMIKIMLLMNLHSIRTPFQHPTKWYNSLESVTLWNNEIYDIYEFTGQHLKIVIR